MAIDLMEATPLTEARAFGKTDNARKPDLDGTLFSLRFVVTYHWILLALIILLTVWHYVQHWHSLSWQILSSHDATDASCCLSSDSESLTYGDHESLGSSTHITKGESTPLLDSAVKHRRFLLRKLLIRKARAVLMYHPTIHTGILGNDTTAIVLLLLGINLFYALYDITFTRSLVFVLADRAGLLFVCNLPWLYLLSAKNQPFRLLINTSYESLNILHRALGKWLTLLAITHTAGMITVWYDFLRPRGYDLWWFLSQNMIWTGLVAFSCYIVLYITSRAAFRQWWYEMFLATHIILQAGGLLFLFLHHHRTRVNVGAALFILLVDRLVYRYALKTRSFQADLSIMDDGETIMVSANWLRTPIWPRSLHGLLPSNLRQGWQTSDHVFLSVPAMARKHVMQAHPFTIASAAPDEHHREAWLSLIIRARDGFTKDLLQFAQSHPSTLVRLDGPYGSTRAYDMLASSDAALVVAGGSGIAVAYPILWHLLQKRPPTMKVSLLWVVHDASHISWIGRERIEELENMGLQLILPPPTNVNGRPDVSRLAKDSIRELCGMNFDTKVGVVISGPNAMNRTVRNACSSLAWAGLDIHVAVEVFDW